MRLLIATDSFAPKIDGVAETAGVLTRFLARRGHAVTVVTPAPGAADADGARVVRVPSLPLPLYPEMRVAYQLRQLAAAVRHARPDAVIVLTIGPVGVWALRSLNPAVPVVHIYTTDMPAYLTAYHAGVLVPVYDRLLRWMGRRSLTTLAPTEVIRDDLAARGVVRLGTWGRGVDTTLFNPNRRSSEMRHRLSGGEPDRPLVLYVGRLAREKRILDLLEATRTLRHARFALVGDGPQRAELERLFPADRTVFTGYLRGEQLAEAFASADVFAFPSDTDTFAQVVLQALASGVPPVVAAPTAPAQFVPHGRAGLHAPARSPRDFAAAIGQLIADHTLHARLAEHTVDAVAGHSWDQLLDQLEALLIGSQVPATSKAD